MKKLNHYEVKILKDGKTSFVSEKRQVVIENELWIVINSRHFEKVTKDKMFETGHCMLNKPKIHARENDRIFDNGVFYELYTDKKKRPETIRKEIERFINERYGYLASVDLTFIK